MRLDKAARVGYGRGVGKGTDGGDSAGRSPAGAGVGVALGVAVGFASPPPAQAAANSVNIMADALVNRWRASILSI